MATIDTITEGKGRCATCMHVKIEQLYGPSETQLVCGLATSTDGKPDNQATLAFAKDGEEYWAQLVVKPTFGCVQWEDGDHDDDSGGV